MAEVAAWADCRGQLVVALFGSKPQIPFFWPHRTVTSTRVGGGSIRQVVELTFVIVNKVPFDSK